MESLWEVRGGRREFLYSRQVAIALTELDSGLETLLLALNEA
jgi:hypothetical protein